MEIVIALNDVKVGSIRLAGTARDETEFSFFEEYRQRDLQPILSQFFLGKLDQVHSRRQHLHPFFSNLLPEGPLRALIAQREGVSPTREYYLLAALGADLPGAVVATPDATPGEDAIDAAVIPEDAGKASTSPVRLRFSLAGVQLKFSMVREGRGLTLPFSGKDGDWLVKLPDPRHRGVPRNEWSMMTWAGRAGISVPEVDLVPTSLLAGLPPSTELTESEAFAIRRFDRPAPGRRIHIEDFAQVLGVYPTTKGKYESTNFETLANIVRRIAGPDDLDEMIRRLVFIVAIGNGDAHVKNWSLIYEDGVHARLSPAYDLVSTLPYISDESLALNLDGSKRFERVSIESFLRLARKIGEDEQRIRQVVLDAVGRTWEAWQVLKTDLPLEAMHRDLLEQHMKRVPVIQGR